MDGEPFDPLFHLSGEAVAEGVYQVDDDFFLDRVVRRLPDAAGIRLARPGVSRDGRRRGRSSPPS